MHQTQWGPERPLPPPVSLASQSHHEKPPEVTCTSRGNPGFPASTRERPRETFFNTSRGQIPLPWLGSNDALPLATRTNAEIAGHVGHIQKLAAPGCQRSQEALKERQISDLAERPYVALEIRLNVARMPQRKIPIWVRDKFRVSAAQETLPHVEVRKCPAGRWDALGFPWQ